MGHSFQKNDFGNSGETDREKYTGEKEKPLRRSIKEEKEVYYANR
jgi:hypothetical protein